MKLANTVLLSLRKNSPAIQETWVRSLGREGPLEEGMAIQYSQYSCLENPMDRWARWATVPQGLKVLDSDWEMHTHQEEK